MMWTRKRAIIKEWGLKSIFVIYVYIYLDFYLDTKPSTALDSLQVLLEGCMSGHLESSSTGNNTVVLNGVLHGTQTVTDSILNTES